MAMITKTAPGSAEDMKYIKNAKNMPKTAKGGTQRTSFTGSSDNRISSFIFKPALSMDIKIISITSAELLTFGAKPPSSPTDVLRPLFFKTDFN